MSTDTRGHTVPAGTDVFDPQGSDVALSPSINDFILAVNATDRASKAAAVSPTSDRPALIYQTDTDTLWRHNATTGAAVCKVPVTPDTAWMSTGIIFGNGFTAYAGSGWAGVQWKVTNGICTVSGAVTNGAAWVAGAIPCNIPAPYRPTVQTAGAGAFIATAGDVTLYAAGSGATSFAVTYPLGV